MRSGVCCPCRAKSPFARRRILMPRVSGEKVKAEGAPQKTKASTCGLIMPISALDGCALPIWAEVKSIITETVESIADPVFSVKLVSDGDAVGIIQKRIVQNVYASDIVVCDVSGKNPNVMFELGLRLAFDKPTIIVKDDKTAYSFDTSAIEHLDYPRDLRFSKIVDFKNKLSAKIQATHQKSTSDSSYTTFLKHFGEFTVAKLDKKEVSGQEYILEELHSIRTSIGRLERTQAATSDPGKRMRPAFRPSAPDFDVCRSEEHTSELQSPMYLVCRL